MATPRKTPTTNVSGHPQRSITEWISVFQFEEYGQGKADAREGRAMRHFNIFLARRGGLPSKVSKHSKIVNAPIGQLTADHFRDFLAWITTEEPQEDVGKEWYAPVLAKFIQWLKRNKAITDGKRREFFSALRTAGAEH